MGEPGFFEQSREQQTATYDRAAALVDQIVTSMAEWEILEDRS
jgi:hypothetical protein